MAGEYFRIELNGSDFVSAIVWDNNCASVRISGTASIGIFTKEKLVETIQMLNSVLEKVNSYE